jgi:serine kinase of HPr protein (carbohydrate metabolism regulator)
MNSVFKNTYRIIHFEFRLTTCVSLLADLTQHLFSGFPPATNPTVDFSTTVLQDGSISLTQNHIPFKQFKNSDQFAAQFEWLVMHRALKNMPFLGLHAGAVSFGSKTLLFPGHSGRGKTTLTLCCLAKGAHLITDEVALVHPETTHLSPFPRTLNIKQGTLKHLPILLPSVDSSYMRKIYQATCLSVSAFSCVPTHETRTIDGIVFPHYHPQSRTNLQAIKKSQALMHLFEHTTNRQQFPTTCLNILANIVEKVPCFKLSMNNIEDALTQLNTGLGSPLW